MDTMQLLAMILKSKEMEKLFYAEKCLKYAILNRNDKSTTIFNNVISGMESMLKNDEDFKEFRNLLADFAEKKLEKVQTLINAVSPLDIAMLLENSKGNE